VAPTAQQRSQGKKWLLLQMTLLGATGKMVSQQGRQLGEQLGWRMKPVLPLGMQLGEQLGRGMKPEKELVLRSWRVH